MSCGNPAADVTDTLMERRTKFDKSTWCIKCKTERGNLVIRHTVYCKNCFFPLVRTKFRRSIEPHVNESQQVSKRTALKASGNLLVGFSGGLGSTVLLDLLSSTYFPSVNGASLNGKGGKSHPRNKRVWAKAYACYVEVCGAFPELNDRSAEIRKYFEGNEDFEFVSARLEDAFDPVWWGKVSDRNTRHSLYATFASEDLPLFRETLPSDTSHDTPISLLRLYLSSLPTQTAVQATVSVLTRLLLVYTARRLQCSHLALGTSLTSLSISLITSVAQGGGFNLRNEYSEEWRDPSGTDGADDRRGEMPVKIVRPLQDIGMKECTAWAYWKQLSIVGKGKLSGTTGKQTIGSLTKNFIVGLERDYPSTVSTIVRTCNKVVAKDEAQDCCVLCERAMPSGVPAWKARISVRSQTDNNSVESQEDSDELRQRNGPQADCRHLSSRLCYACHTHLTSKSSRSSAAGNEPIILPQWTNASLIPILSPEPSGTEAGEIWSASTMSQETMKAVVNDFLL
ncbi:CTU2 [Sanghuangporus sanghuang]